MSTNLRDKVIRLRVLAQFALVGAAFFGCFSGFFPKSYNDLIHIVGAVTALFLAILFKLDQLENEETAATSE